VKRPSTSPLPPQQATILATLRAQAGVCVPYATIIGAIWPEKDPATAVRLLHQQVYLLRQALPPGSISTATGYGYAWTAPPSRP
jgi:DNA-binding winged helix-turn-helix (wHTH) protein